MALVRWSAAAALALGCAMSKEPVTRSEAASEANQRAFRQLVDAWARGDAETVGSLAAPGYVGHVAAGERDVEGLKRRVTEFAALYSDVRFSVEDQFSSGDRVASRMTCDVVERRSGRRIRLMGINIARYEGGKLAEEWNTWEPLRSAP